MVSRRRFLALTSAGVALTAGCSLGGRDTDDQADTNTTRTDRQSPAGTRPGATATPTGNDPETATPTGSDPETNAQTSTDRMLDIREFGAAVDGETDDTAAVREAVAAAGPHDTVLFPPGVTLVSGPETDDGVAIPLSGDEIPPNLTLAGAGRASVLRTADDQPQDYETFHLNVQSGIEGLGIRDMRLDGNKSGQSFAPGSGGHGIESDNADSAEVPVDVRLTNLWVENFNMSGIKIRHAGTVIDRCTVRGNVKHGLGLDTTQDVDRHDPPIRVQYCRCVDNGHEGAPVTYGIDCSGGKIVVEDTVCAGNAQGTKTTPDAIDIRYRRVRLANNSLFGYIRPGSDADDRGTVVFEDVVSADNGQAGFRFSKDTDYEIGEVVATGNWKTNVYVTANARVTGETIWASQSREGFGLYCDSSVGGSIATYHPYENARGATDLEGNLELGTSEHEAKTDLENVPNAPDVGAGTVVVASGDR